MKRRVGILISGRGSNMLALIEAASDKAYPAEIAIVLSNRETAEGLVLARERGVPALAIPAKRFGSDRIAHERALQSELERAGVDILCLAGYMRILTPSFVAAWAGRALNIHPSLLPAYPGLDTHRRVLEAGETEHGCTVHLVTKDMDEGPILAQARLPVLENDTEDSLAARVLVEEHRIYPEALARYIHELDSTTLKRIS
jgi:formyltetrahydrofolate-dependent phosphoribosylglycinamide formyltransferase